MNPATSKPHLGSAHQAISATAGHIYADGTYLSKNPTWHEEHSSWKAKQVDVMLRKHGIKPSTIAEVGCGAGEILSCLASIYGSDVRCFGYEVSPQAFELCRPKETKNIHYCLKDLFLEPEDITFDVVMAIDVFEHVEDYIGFVRKLKGRAKYKIFHIPLDISVQLVMRGTVFQKLRDNIGHIHYFTKETALATLKSAGYEIVDCFYTRSALELGRSDIANSLLRIPRGVLFSIHQGLTARILGGFPLLVLAK